MKERPNEPRRRRENSMSCLCYVPRETDFPAEGSQVSPLQPLIGFPGYSRALWESVAPSSSACVSQNWQRRRGEERRGEERRGEERRGEERMPRRTMPESLRAELFYDRFPPSHFMTGIVMSLEFGAASDWATRCSSLALSDSGTGSNRHPGHRAINHPAGTGLHFLNDYQFLQGTKRALWALGSKNLSTLSGF
ncbi:unnamed protein product [Pleuronectes platessa]|uniref:Uncharacterized protein n=1 Tax=Pleuronectes platessa TaxID=8262 RepID=A0A9N7YSS4_PLEPL|nr:unnamed protein product [Pleuronectes platessa]